MLVFQRPTASLIRQPHCSTIGYDRRLFSAMTIYNFGFYITYHGPTADTALPKMFSDMSPGPNTYGGRAFIPQQNFPVHASSTGYTVPDQCDIDGSGGGGALGSTLGSAFFHFIITPTGGAGGSVFLNCTDAGGGAGHTSGGMYFRSLAFQWPIRAIQRTRASPQTYGTLKRSTPLHQLPDCIQCPSPLLHT